MKIIEIKATEKIEEMWHLLEAHREELTTHKHIMQLKPDVSRYKLLEDAGKLISLGVYEDDGTPIGYSINFLHANLHYSGLMMIQNDILFLDKKHRRGSIGVQILKKTEEIAKERGAMFALYHAKPNTPFQALLQKMGYDVQDIIFSKEIV